MFLGRLGAGQSPVFFVQNFKIGKGTSFILGYSSHKFETFRTENPLCPSEMDVSLER